MGRTGVVIDCACNLAEDLSRVTDLAFLLTLKKKKKKATCLPRHVAWVQGPRAFLGCTCMNVISQRGLSVVSQSTAMLEKYSRWLYNNVLFSFSECDR